MVLCLLGVNSGGHGLHGDDLLVVGRPHGAHYEKRGAALGVSGVLQLLVSRDLQDVIYHCGQVVHPDLVPTKVPELGLVRVEGGVVSRVPITPRISQPNVVVVVGQQIGC